MTDTERDEASGVYYAELLAAKVVEGIRDFPGVDDGQRQAMIELVAAMLTVQARGYVANHASE